MKVKVAVFSGLLYMTSFLATMVFISSSALFVNHIGASSVSKVIIMFGLITPLVIFVLQSFYSLVKKYEYVFILYIAIFITGLLITCYLSVTGAKDLSYWMFYVLGFSGYSLNKIVSWNLAGRYFNVVDSRKYFPILTAFQEGGSITSALLINFVITNAAIVTYVKTGSIALIGIFAVFLFLLTPKAQAFKANHCFKAHKKTSAYMVNHFKFLKKYKVFIFLAGMFLITILFEQFMTYELNMTFGEQFDSVAKISKAFALYKICESSFVIFANVFLGRIMNRYVQLGNIFIIYAVVLFFAMAVLNVSSFWLFVPIVSFARHCSKYFMFMPSYEQALNSLDSSMRIALKSFFEGVLVPIFICVSGFALMAFSSPHALKYLNVMLQAMAVVMIVLAIYFKKKYIKFHINRLASGAKELVVKSIQALGENKNYDAVAPLMDVLTSAESMVIKKNVILSFGRIRIKDLLETLYKEAKNEQEEIQIAAFESLSKHDSFLVQRFLIDLIQGGVCRSLASRMSLIKILYNSLGSAMVPILLPYLNNDDSRIVANTIEAMEPISDKRIIEILTPYLDNQNRRVKGNAIIVLYKFRSKRQLCMDALMNLYNSSDAIDRNTFLYVVGRLKLKKYKKYLANFEDDASSKLNLALAYCKIEDQKGYELFADILISIEKDKIHNCLHHFSQLEDGVKLRVLSVYASKIKDEKHKKVLLSELKKSCFDFHEARDYLKLQTT